MNAFITTSYVSRVCSLPPLVARAALLHGLGSAGSLRGEHWELRIDAVNGADLSATLLAGRTLRAAVAVEIEPWSSSRVLVGIRHRARAVPWWSAAYFAAAHDATASVAAALLHWADEPLRELTKTGMSGFAVRV